MSPPIFVSWEQYSSLFWALQRKSRILFWALFWVDHSQEHFFELITHKSTFLSALLINETFLNTFLRTQKSGFALKSVFLSEFALLRAFLSAQKSTQGPTEPLWKQIHKNLEQNKDCRAYAQSYTPARIMHEPLRLPQVSIKPRKMHSSSFAVHWRRPAELG